jgi:hypothetical protein
MPPDFFAGAAAVFAVALAGAFFGTILLIFAFHSPVSNGALE